MTFVILATGQSLSMAQIDYVKEQREKSAGKLTVMVVSDAYRLAPWADVMVSFDVNWWRKNQRAADFEGIKFCASPCWGGIGHYRDIYNMPQGCNSGLYGMYVARYLGAQKIILLGFDMWGTHFFGQHPEGLKNTNEKRFRDHIFQFESWKDGAEVINCTPESSLIKFPMMTIQEALPC